MPIALVIAPLVREHGLDYLIATVLLGGALQIVLSVLGVARLMRFVPRSVMVGFVNALAILIFLSQLPYLIGVPALVYPFVAVGLLIMVFLPKLTTAIPAPLIAIVVLTAAVLVFKVHIPNVGDEGELPTSLPTLLVPHVPLNAAHPVDHRAVRAGDGAGRTAGIAADRQAGRRHHRHPQQQDPRELGSGRRQHRHRLLRRHGRLRDDRPDDDQREGRPVPAPASRRSWPGCSCWVSSSDSATSSALIPMAALVAVMIMVSVGTMDWHSIAPVHAAPDAAQRDAGHGRHRGGHRRHATTSPTASSSAR